jgi:hypothetical protein
MNQPASSSSQRATHMKAEDCTPEQLCVRCSMVKVIAHRFAIFREAFGREPLPTEPLFFVNNAERPVAAQQQEVNVQLAEAAEETGISLVKISHFLGIEHPIRSTTPPLRAVK